MSLTHLLGVLVFISTTGGQNESTLVPVSTSLVPISTSAVEVSNTLPEPTSTLTIVSGSSEVLLQPVIPTPVEDAGSGSTLPGLSPITPTPVPPMVVSGSSITIAQANLSRDFVGDGLCGCDLLVGQCDVLCCCDMNCSPASGVVFDCPTESASKVCLDFSGVFSTRLSQCSCADSSLLCILYEQDPSRLEYGPAVVVENTEQFSIVELQHGLPGDAVVLAEPPSYSSNYSVGDPILVVNTGMIVPYFEILTVPAPFNGIICHDGNPITYLTNQQYKCSRSLDDLSTACATLSAMTYADLRLLQIPDDLSHGEDSGGLPLEVSDVSCRTNSPTPVQCRLMPAVFDPDRNICRNSVLQANFVFIHDGGGCLLNASVKFVLGEVGDGSLIQQYSVEFVKDGSSTLAQLRRSGNPGYISGETILAGSLTNPSNIKITVDRNLWLHVKGSGKRCTKERPRIPILFGHDLFATCLMVISRDDLVTDCPGVRRRAYSVLSTDIALDHVGIYGNSDPTNISQWLRIINDTVEPSGEPSLRSLCTGVPTTLDIAILYSNTGDFTQPQPVLSGIRFVYFTQNIVSEFISSGNLVMSTSVRFIDVSAEGTRILPPVTATVMELPRDFLYPFFVSSALTFSISHMGLFPVSLLLHLYLVI